MAVVREVPPPSLQELGGYLPSRRFPSDHLPVVFDLAFRNSSSSSGGDGTSGQPGSLAAAGASSDGTADGSAAGSAAPPPGAGNVLPAAMYNVGLAAEALQRDEVVALPTDTLYGLAACANSTAAVAHIYATKRRGDHKPLAITVADVADVARYGEAQVGAEGCKACFAGSSCSGRRPAVTPSPSHRLTSLLPRSTCPRVC